jgi:hypothetical protein
MPVAPLIFAGLSLIEKMIPMIQSWRKAAKQNAELTPEQDAELDARIAQITSQAHWKPDGQ